MPARADRAKRRADLRFRLVARAEGMCEWSGCGQPGAHMAHIVGIGTGGDPTGSRDELDNVVFLCVLHHDILDGRSTQMRLKYIEDLLLELVQRRSR